MKKLIPTFTVTIVSFILLSLIFYCDYELSDSDKLIFIIFFSIVIGYLYNLKTNTENTINKLLRAEKISKVGFWSLDFNDNKLFWSNEIYDIFEIDSKDFKPSYEAFLSAIHPEDKESVNNAYTKSLENKQKYKINHRLLMGDGRIKWVQEKCETEFDKEGNPIISIGIVTDITKEIEYIHKVEKSEKTLHSIINATDDLIFFKDKEFKYLGCNEAFLKFVGKSKDEILGFSDFDLFDKESAQLFRDMDMKMLTKNKISSNYEWITYPDGNQYYVITKKIPFNYAQNDIGILGIARDITELHISQERIKEQSYIDELTKLHNRKSYNERIEELLALKKRKQTTFSIIMYDIDNFKQINDKFGHKTGDIVLIDMSKLVKSLIRESDYLFRIGGEEFVILLTETNIENAKKVSEKILKSVENNLKDITGNIITISIGVTEAIENDSEDSIFKRVDELLYESKNTGKNKISY